MRNTIALLLALGISLEAPAQTTPPTRARNEVRILYTDYFRRDQAHRHYAQPAPVRLSTPSGPVTFHSRCVWIQEEPLPPWHPPVEAVEPPIDTPRFTLVGKVMRFEFPDPHRFPGDPGVPYEEPLPTKPDFLEAGDGSDTPDDTDTTALYGPDLDLAASHDLADWIPEFLTVSLFGRALFGEAEICGAETDMAFYAAGLRLAARLFEAGDFRLDTYAAAGPGWLRTELGDASGIDTALGLRADWNLTESLGLSGGVEFNGFFSDDLLGHGIAVTVGPHLRW